MAITVEARKDAATAVLDGLTGAVAQKKSKMASLQARLRTLHAA